jgi:hypothetical protein
MKRKEEEKKKKWGRKSRSPTVEVEYAAVLSIKF